MDARDHDVGDPNEDGNLMSNPTPHLNEDSLGRYKKLGQFTRSGRFKWMMGAGVILALFVARPLFAADLSGTWEIAYWVGEDRQFVTLEVVHEGSVVLGGGTMRGGSPGSVAEVEVRSGTAGGGAFHFVLVEEGGVASHGQEFTGKWYRDEMSGQTDGAFGARMFSGARRRLVD